MRISFCLAVGMFCGALALHVIADDVALAPREGVLLLNNGELIAGTIVAAGDRYDVVRKDVEIHLKRSGVAAACRDAHECYLHRRSGIEQGRVQDHLELAEWCLKNGLLDDGETEIEAARSADPAHPKIRLLEPRLQLARQAPEHHESPPVEKDATTQQLDSMARNLAGGSMESFTNGIQPMLLNYCTKSGCHGTRSAGTFRLDRIPPNRLAGRHVTQRNLAEALAMIDRAKPEESKLLQMPIRPHGNMKVAVFTDREQSQYKQLVQWVYLVARGKDAQPRPSVEERTAPLLQTVPRKGHARVEALAVDPPQAKAKAAAKSDWSDSFPDQTGVRLDPAAAGRMSGAPKRNAQSPTDATGQGDGDTFRPKDAFDPELFNRRFFAR